MSKWDGQIGSTRYDHGLLIVSHIGTTYYLSVSDQEVLKNWITHIRCSLECNFANSNVIEFRSSKASFEVPSYVGNVMCPISGLKLSSVNNSSICYSCGYGYHSDCVMNVIPVLQINQESSLIDTTTTTSSPPTTTSSTTTTRICQNCYHSQIILLFIKKLLNVHLLLLHERTQEVLTNINRFKASFKLRRCCSERLNMAAILREEESVTDEEFNELQQVDYEYRQEHMLFEYNRMKNALYVLGNDMQSMLGFLSNPSGLSALPNGSFDAINGSLKLYFLVILRLVTLADVDPDLIDFYWPQIIHIHLILSKKQTMSSMGMVDLLQQGLLAIALKYPQLAVKLSWALLASIDDYRKDKSITQTQYASCLCLLLQLEVHTYGVASCLTGIDNSTIVVKEEDKKINKSILMNVLHPANHQKQELVIELYTLIRIRRKSHKVHFEEIRQAADIVAKKEGEVNNTHVKFQELNIEKDVGSIFEDSTTRKDDNRLYCVDLFLDNFNDKFHHCDDENNDDLSKNRSESNDKNEDNSDVVVPKHDDVDDVNPADKSFTQKVIWQGLSDQLDWVESLTDLVDTLRFVERPERTEALKKGLESSFCDPSSGMLLSFALDPTSVGGEPMYQLKRLFIEETRVFRTKARAPSLLVFEVERSHHHNETKLINDLKSTSDDEYMNTSKRRGGSFDIVKTHTSTDSEQEVNNKKSDVLDVMQMLDDKLPNTISSIHKVEEERKSLSNSTSKHRRSVSGSDLTVSDNSDSNEAISIQPPVLRQSQSSTELNSNIASVVTPRSKRLSSTGNFNAITKVDFQEDNETPPPLPDVSITVKEGEDVDDFIYIPRISDDVPEEEIAISQRVINSAVKLYNTGQITKEEYHQLVDSNAKYRHEAKSGEEEAFRAKLEGYFGVDWETKKRRLLGISIDDCQNDDDVNTNNDDDIAEDDDQSDRIHHHSHKRLWPERDLRSFIVKSNDDLRQEVACIQLIELCQEIFVDCNLSDTLWLKPYRIVSTGQAAGFVETLPNTMSIDAIKKTDNFVSLPHFFQNLYGSNVSRYEKTKRNFVKSLAAYSLVSYILCIKDRHNGNILIDQEGHVIHIDFGFLLGIAPGGSFSIETAPFKLTEEMLDVFGGIDSDMFSEFVKAFTQGFLALRSKSTAILSAVSLIANDSSFPCFQGKDTNMILDRLRQRFKCELSSADAIEHCLDLIIQSYSNLGTRQYDSFQWYTNGIIP